MLGIERNAVGSTMPLWRLRILMAPPRSAMKRREKSLGAWVTKIGAESPLATRSRPSRPARAAEAQSRRTVKAIAVWIAPPPTDAELRTLNLLVFVTLGTDRARPTPACAAAILQRAGVAVKSRDGISVN